MSNDPVPIVVMASGQGSTFEAIVTAVKEKKLNAEVRALFVSRSDCGAVERARRLGVPAIVFEPKVFPSAESWDKEMTRALSTLAPSWIVLAGFTSKIGPHILNAFKGRVVNTHPSLLPKYGGQGMYGMKVHEAVIANGEAESGISVHVVTENYDEGPILAQEKVAVQPGDSAHQLAERIKAREKTFYVDALRKIMNPTN